MKNRKTIALLVCFVAPIMQAQQGSTATGGNASGNGGSISYSIGQVAYATYSGANGTVSCGGVQQAYEISEVLNLPEFKDISLQLQAYPNPTVDFLTLNIGDSELSGLNFQLFDIGGKLIERKKITSNIETISMV